MEEKYIPELKKPSFICPHCRAYTSMNWHSVNPAFMGNTFPLEKIAISSCMNCRELSVWMNGKMIYPEASKIEPNKNMPTKAKKFFSEAQSIIGRSPRAASALLRLSLEEIVNSLNGTGKNLVEKIDSLALPEDMMTLFNACRLYGNQASHPGVIDFNEPNSIEVAYNLSNLINVIVELKISPFLRAKALIQELNNKKAN